MRLLRLSRCGRRLGLLNLGGVFMFNYLKSFMVVTGLLAAHNAAPIHVHNVPAVVVGGVMTTGGLLIAVANEVAYPVYKMLVKPALSKSIRKGVRVAGVAGVLAGLGLYNYGKSGGKRAKQEKSM